MARKIIKKKEEEREEHTQRKYKKWKIIRQIGRGFHWRNRCTVQEDRDKTRKNAQKRLGGPYRRRLHPGQGGEEWTAKGEQKKKKY